MGSTEYARIEMRLPPSEKEKIEKSAASLRMSLTDYIRACCLHKKVMDTAWIPDITKQIIRIGVNINQIATVANQNGSVTQAQLDLTNQNLILVQNQLKHIVERMEEPTDSRLYECRELLRKIADKLDAMEMNE